LVSHILGVFIFNKRFCYSRLAGGFACIGSRAHVAIVWQARARCALRAARTEQEGEDEEEGH